MLPVIITLLCLCVAVPVAFAVARLIMAKKSRRDSSPEAPVAPRVDTIPASYAVKVSNTVLVSDDFEPEPFPAKAPTVVVSDIKKVEKVSEPAKPSTTKVKKTKKETKKGTTTTIKPPKAGDSNSIKPPKKTAKSAKKN